MSKGRKIARAHISPQLNQLLEFLEEKLGMSEAEIIRMCLLDYVDRHNLLSEYLHKDFLKPKTSS